jgi:hypothetical protein
MNITVLRIANLFSGRIYEHHIDMHLSYLPYLTIFSYLDSL